MLGLKGWPEGLAKGGRADNVHCPWLEVHQNGTRHVAASSCFVEVHTDAFKLQVRIAVVADYLPELGSNLIPALTALDVDQLTRVVNNESKHTQYILLLLLVVVSLGGLVLV